MVRASAIKNSLRPFVVKQGTKHKEDGIKAKRYNDFELSKKCLGPSSLFKTSTKYPLSNNSCANNADSQRVGTGSPFASQAYRVYCTYYCVNNIYVWYIYIYYFSKWSEDYVLRTNETIHRIKINLH